MLLVHYYPLLHVVSAQELQLTLPTWQSFVGSHGSLLCHLQPIHLHSHVHLSMVCSVQLPILQMAAAALDAPTVDNWHATAMTPGRSTVAIWVTCQT
jgi:hypothetical protein